MEEKLQQLSISKALILGLVLAVVYYFAVYDNGDSRRNRIKSVQKQVSAKQKELQAMQTEIRKAKEVEAMAAALQGNMAVAVKAAPENLTGIELMKLLSGEAKVVGANIVSINTANANRRRPSPRGRRGAQDKPPIFEPIAVTIKLESTYNQLMLFLSNITKTGRLITASNMVIELKNNNNVRSSAAPMLSFSAQFIGYKYNKEGVVDAK